MKSSKNGWYRHRGYVHFDRPLCEKAAELLVLDPRKVAKHSFYPLLSYKVISQKIEKSKATGLVTYKNPKERPIAYAAHADSHIYSYYCEKLSNLYEEKLTKYGLGGVVLAFRSLGKSNIHFANEAFELIKQLGDCDVFTTDITGFFDNLDHRHLKHSWGEILGVESLPPDHYAVFKSLTKFSQVDKDAIFPILGYSKHNPPKSPSRLCSAEVFREKIRAAGLVVTNKKAKGIPQGSPISALLSNIYLLEFDRLLQDKISACGGYYMRYCDDILCIVPSGQSSGLYETVDHLICKYHLSVNEKKTSTHTFGYKNGVLHTDRPLQYLGFTFDGTRKLIRSAAFAKFSEKMRRGVNLAKLTAMRHHKIRSSSGGVWRRKIYERYSHLGKQNFIRYGLKAAKIMDSKGINKQLRPLWERMTQRINRANFELKKEFGGL